MNLRDQMITVYADTIERIEVLGRDSGIPKVDESLLNVDEHMEMAAQNLVDDAVEARRLYISCVSKLCSILLFHVNNRWSCLWERDESNDQEIFRMLRLAGTT